MVHRFERKTELLKELERVYDVTDQKILKECFSFNNKNNNENYKNFSGNAVKFADNVNELFVIEDKLVCDVLEDLAKYA